MSTIEVKGIRLNVEVTGDGPPLVLIHGVGMGLEQWKLEGFVDILSRTNIVFSDY